MKYVKNWVPLLLALAVVVGVMYGAWWLLAQMLAWVMVQPSQIAAAIIAFAGTVIAGIGAVVISQQRAKARDIAESHRPKKTKLYTEFITRVVGIMREHSGGKTLDAAATKNLEDFFFNFTTRLMLWGAPSVLKHYGAFRRVGEKPALDLIRCPRDITV